MIDEMNSACFTFPFIEKGIIDFKNFIEFFSLYSERKKVVRLVLKNSEISEFNNSFLEAFPGYSYRLSSFGLENVYETSNFDKFQKKVFNTHKPDVYRAAYYGQVKFIEYAKYLEENDINNTDLSELFGYPSCCANNYTKIINSKKSWTDFYFGNNYGFENLHLSNNRFSSLLSPGLCYHYDYFPCSFNCAGTDYICKKNRNELLKSNLNEFVPLIDEHCKSFVIKKCKCVYYIPIKILEDNKIIDDDLPKYLIFKNIINSDYCIIKSFEYSKENNFINIDGLQISKFDKNINVLKFSN